MPMKCTMQFTIGRASFTESHYSRTYSDPNAAGAVTAALRLAGFRVALLGAGCVLSRLRLSRTDIPRTINNVSLLGVQTSTDATVTGKITQDADIPNCSVIANANDGAGHSKNLYLAGLPEASIVLDGMSAPMFSFSGILAGTWGSYVAELQAAWNFRVKLPVVPAVQVNNIIAGPVTPIPGVILTTSIPLTAQPVHTPFEVNLSGFRRSSTRTPGLSGLYSCEAYSQALGPPQINSYTLAGTGNVNPIGFLRLGSMSLNGYTYVPYVNISISKGGTRKRGGSAGLPRGRSPIRG